MDERPHLFPSRTAQSEPYTYPRPVGTSPFKVPPRDDRVGHGKQLIGDFKDAIVASEPATSAEQKRRGIVLEFSSDVGFELAIQSLEYRRSGIELLNSRTLDDVMIATVFIPEGKEKYFLKRFEAYCFENDGRSGKPKNQKLVESIQRIKLASIKSFWTDKPEYFPELTTATSFEIWIREDEARRLENAKEFIRQARRFSVNVEERQIQFPERSVLLVTATLQNLLNVPVLFDCVAELRLAKIPNSEFLSLSPREQREFLTDAINRISPPFATSPTVCHLDTGVQSGHPLLKFAIDPQHCLYVHPHDAALDVDGHGTEMAGLALYGCLSELLNHSQDVQLRHCLESVKIFSKYKSNQPQLHGEIMSQAVSRIEIANTQFQRAFCLTVTAADGRDEGYPSSWSAAIDQICAGVETVDTPKRLFLVSAGNIELAERHEYPDRNQTEGVKDPAQSWNAITVGAATWKSTISEQALHHWKTIAPLGSLSPSSRTSIVWDDKAWPVKPDIVMEGGNNAIDPSTSRADFVDDLSLLTTRVSPEGAHLTTTADTSAATALAAKLAAQIWAEYPHLWPESVRALLIHSARWTEKMLSEFPRDADRQNRLRCYGYGTPDSHRALSSMSNAATLIVQESLQAFHEDTDKKIKTKDLHLHTLPWPKQVLQDLGEVPVRMRVTLSYFIEPSPGRRGWDKKYRYQSHGLRFDVKRPLETVQEFQKRISKAAQEDDENITSGSDARNWELGPNLQKKSSIHSDTWIGTAAELAECGILAVFPVTGWWKERNHLNGWKKRARYSLIVSIETDDVTTDLYTTIEQQIQVAAETIIEV